MTERPAQSLDRWCVVRIGPHGTVIARLSPSFDYREEACAARSALRSERGERKSIQVMRERLVHTIEYDEENGS